MKNFALFTFFVTVFIVMGLTLGEANAQSQTSHVVINEVDLNPFGDDAKSVTEWVELYNPTNSKIDIGNWKISSSTGLKKTMTIPIGTEIDPGKFLTYSSQPSWFSDSGESIELKDSDGIVIDKTAVFSDTKNDFTSWQRVYDGFDQDQINDWKFTASTPGSSNGKPVTFDVNVGFSLTVSTNKSNYLFGETAIIEGHVSNQLFKTSPPFQAETIIVKISGPDFNKTILLYPDFNLNYKTTLTLNKVLGITEGLYSVIVNYGGTVSQTNFSVGNKTTTTITPTDNPLTISTDKSQYIPGGTVYVTGLTSQIIPLEGLKFTIKDPVGKTIANGSLYPTNGKFSTSVFLSTVKPVYGTYQLTGNYFDKSSYATFEVVQDKKEDTVISLWTDKETYGLGDTVNISGRLNNVWVGSLDLEVIQTKNIALGLQASGSNSGFKILDAVRMSGDGTFAYSFKIPPDNPRLGDYKITVAKEVGTSSKIIHVVENPDQYVVDKSSISLSTNKAIYDIGETMTITGSIVNPLSSTSFVASVVKISISREDGGQLEIIALPPGAKTRQQNGLTIAYELTAIPDSSGAFSTETKILKGVFTEGTYIIKAEYGGSIKIINVGIIDPLKLGNDALLNLNKQVYGLAEKVLLSGILPPSGATSVTIDLTKPDGSTINSGATVNNQRFSWSWVTPITEKQLSIKSDDRSVTSTNFGIYKIHVSTTSYGEDIFFKVSSDPENDSISLTPLYVTTEKALNKAGEKLKVIGNVIKRAQGSEGLVIPDRVGILVLDSKPPYKQILQASVYPDQGGHFQSLFDLPITIFSEGVYKIKATYMNKKAESTFSVVNDFSFGSDAKLSLLIETDKTQYFPGDIVTITGKPNKLIYLEKFDVSVIKKSDQDITCGSFFCGVHSGPVTTIRPSSSGSFSYQMSIPNSTSSIGSYEITVDAGFETKSVKFDVVMKPLTQEPEKLYPTTIEKVIRIPDSKIEIITAEKTIVDQNILPRVISGSLITTNEDQSNVNLRVTSQSGICVIGQEIDCLVKESTRKPGQIYDVVSVDGINLNVRYSGSDVRLEKFDILPQSNDVFLPNSIWTVDIVKDDQVSRFYYKITYKSLE